MKKKIVLHRETVLDLTVEQREQAVGGTLVFTFGCPSRGCSNNSCDICHEN